MPDLFTTIHSALWTAFNAWPALTGLVRRNVDVTADDFDHFPQNTPADAMPEMTVVQGGFRQAEFKVGDAWADRTQDYSVVVTTANLSPVMANQIKDAALDALCSAGSKLGVPEVISWSVSGRDVMSAEAPAPGVERSAVRLQSLMTVSVRFKKTMARPRAL